MQKGRDREAAKDAGADWPSRTPDCEDAGRRACALKGPAAKVEGVTENVSPRGARVITDSVCAPGKLVRLDAPNEHANLPGRVIYCHPVGEGKFAVGLRLDVRVEKWQKPRKR